MYRLRTLRWKGSGHLMHRWGELVGHRRGRRGALEQSMTHHAYWLASKLDEEDLGAVVTMTGGMAGYRMRSSG